MAKKKSSAENTDKLIAAVEDWMELEDETIKHADAMLKKTKNKLVKMTMEMIKSDSQKHKTMQKLLADSLTKPSAYPHARRSCGSFGRTQRAPCRRGENA